MEYRILNRTIKGRCAYKIQELRRGVFSPFKKKWYDSFGFIYEDIYRRGPYVQLLFTSMYDANAQLKKILEGPGPSNEWKLPKMFGKK